ILSITFLIIFAQIFVPSFKANAETSDKQFYAKVQTTGVQFCSSPSENTALFEIPYSYFVKIDYSVDDYYKVFYQDLSGYVRKDKITLMNGTPNQPYAQATFNLVFPFSLYKSTSQSSQVLTTLDTTANIKYYGTKTGDSIGSKGNVWYYAGTENDGIVQYGYIFSYCVDITPSISVNNEVFDVITEEFLTTASSTEFGTLSTGTKIILIVAISVPSVLILYFLIKPTRVLQNAKSRKQPKNQRRKIRHGDYFEFDESEL
ncbi:MAG: hypothetical protein K2K31_03560, partial [Clostridia bacterium]|nr:hypothetical protein [Clostridia bacterium]